MQIAQIVTGATYALIHLFVSYDIPVEVPYNVISSFPSSLSTAASSVSSATRSVATAASSAGVGAMLKKLALRAAGEEGLAENVPKQAGDPSGDHHHHLGFGRRGRGATEKLREEIRYRTEYQTVPCLHTSGEVFAILVNVIYLLPLT